MHRRGNAACGRDEERRGHSRERERCIDAVAGAQRSRPCGASRIQPSDTLSQALERNFYADETPVLHRQLHQRAEAEHQEFLALAQRSNLRLVKQYNEAKVRGRGG